MPESVTQTHQRKNPLGLIDIALFSFCAIFILDTISASAKIGPSSIGWWVVCAILYLLPYGLISAELGTTFPDEGGLAVWARKAFGERFSGRTTWLYWVNVALWMPSVYVLFSGMFAALFWLAMPMSLQIVLAIVMCWLTVFLNITSLYISKWVPNAGAIAKVIVVVAIVGAAIYAIASGRPMANDMHFQNLLPSFGAGLAFLPVIVYNFSGFELVSGAAGEMRHPQRDIPVAVIASGICIAGLYILSSGALLAVIPLDQLNLVSGITDMLAKVFASAGLSSALVDVIGTLALFTFFANMVTWTLGANRVALEAARHKQLPHAFGTTFGPHKTPLGAGILTGIVATVVLLIYACFATTASDLFWSLFAFSSIIFLMPYMLLFAVFLKLRKSHADTPRPYKVPGPRWFHWLICGIAELFLLESIVFFIWSPGNPVTWGTTAPLVIGVAVTIIIGEVLIRLQNRKKA